MTKDELILKLTSRKFWVCVAMFLASIASSIAGLAVQSELVAGIGLFCGILSGAIFAACETKVDVARIQADQTTTTKQITANSNDKLTVANALNTVTPETTPAAE